MTEPVRVETLPTDRCPLTLDYPVVDGRKFYASDEDGRPWDVKGSMVNGIRPTFKFWQASTRRSRTLTVVCARVVPSGRERDSRRVVADGSRSELKDHELD